MGTRGRGRPAGRSRIGLIPRDRGGHPSPAWDRRAKSARDLSPGPPAPPVGRRHPAPGGAARRVRHPAAIWCRRHHAPPHDRGPRPASAAGPPVAGHRRGHHRPSLDHRRFAGLHRPIIGARSKRGAYAPPASRGQDDRISGREHARTANDPDPGAYAPFETQYELVLEGKLIRLDIAWPWWRVAAEVDGWGVRSRSRTKFDEDRYRMNLLLAYGWRVAHLTSAMSQARILGDVGRLLPISPV